MRRIDQSRSPRRAVANATAPSSARDSQLAQSAWTAPMKLALPLYLPLHPRAESLSFSRGFARLASSMRSSLLLPLHLSSSVHPPSTVTNVDFRPLTARLATIVRRRAHASLAASSRRRTYTMSPKPPDQQHHRRVVCLLRNCAQRNLMLPRLRLAPIARASAKEGEGEASSHSHGVVSAEKNMRGGRQRGKDQRQGP